MLAIFRRGSDLQDHRPVYIDGPTRQRYWKSIRNAGLLGKQIASCFLSEPCNDALCRFEVPPIFMADISTA